MRMDKNLYIPLAILVAGGLVAGALFMSRGDKPADTGSLTGTETNASLDNVRPIDETDHILGNPDADIIIVEYSDTECPFCKQFHNTMHQIMDQYGADGKVAWVYRHFPIPQLHPNAPKQAEALECAARIGGNDAFWKYTDRVYEITPSNNGLDMALLPQIAAEIGLDKVAFEGCLNNGTTKERVDADALNAVEVGGRGTPTSVLITKSGKKALIPGAYPYQNMVTIIEEALDQI
ncbi:MAG: disulfide bond formation protein DsbA [Candidatus Zambryskibacteria bacterium CG10_big_fil_rev_8_21_14_0_10_42_12]|uniref:Disulfide bond formation protein DsbA n=1 Tax=Candidatus Zambryskibacteria bacterium CG10_big_fil_rev_8_21_14_0_10_42_12 TaxID=1975115 RepID=A0A2H0QUH5_9BACT|nr:MAG: disulfide bond formation protein DsbA [Candidatus Zambryskibacteria bacterium CG10_big_fil_rev_8_21_14_0_10_42_12]